MMKKILACCLVFIMFLTIFNVSSREIDTLQKFFVYSLHIDGDTRVTLVEYLKTIKRSENVTPNLISSISDLISEMDETEIKDMLTIYSKRSEGNKLNIQDILLFGAKEMPFVDNIPTIAAEFNSLIIGNPADNRGIGYFSTLIAIYNMFSIFGGDSTIATNHELPGLISLFVSEKMPNDVIEKTVGALNFMPSLKDTISSYPGKTLLHQLLSFAEQIINDCESEEIYYFKLALDKLGVFEGVASNPDNNKKYPGITFRDVDLYEWSISQISKLVYLGIINGMSRYVFAPEENVTREQFVKMLVSAFDIKGESTLPFKDINENDWYYPYISAAYANNIITGISDDNFGVENNITREQMATMVYRVCIKNGISLAGGTQVSFSDKDNISDFAKEAVNSMSAHAIIKGVGNNIFLPTEPANRAQAAVIIYNIMAYSNLID